MGSKAPDPPDYTPIAMASMQNSQAGQQFSADQLAWAKQQFYENKATTDKVVDMSLQNAQIQQDEAKQAYQRYQTQYQPIEDKLIGQVNDWASPTRIAAQEGSAEATAQQQGAQARTASQQQLESFGINPSSTRYAAMDVGNRTATGASAAAAGTNAANLAQQQQLGLESQAINIGRGYPGQTSAEFGGSTSAGASANNATNQTFQAGSNAMNTGFGTGMGVSNNALSTWGNTLNMGYQNQLSASQQSSGIGGLLGSAAGIAAPFLMGMAEGGAVPTMGYAGAGTVAPPYPGGNPQPPVSPSPDGTPGGAVPTGASPTNGQSTDDVPAALTAGEFVMPKDVTQWIGEQGLQKMIQKSRKEMMTAQAKPSPTATPPGPPTFASRPPAQQGAVPMGVA
jgi:hypothetical protein